MYFFNSIIYIHLKSKAVYIQYFNHFQSNCILNLNSTMRSVRPRDLLFWENRPNSNCSYQSIAYCKVHFCCQWRVNLGFFTKLLNVIFHILKVRRLENNFKRKYTFLKSFLYQNILADNNLHMDLDRRMIKPTDLDRHLLQVFNPIRPV